MKAARLTPAPPTANTGFSSTVLDTATNSSQVYPDGKQYTSWNARMTWSSTNDGLNLYTTGTDGCRSFQTGESGKFTVYYDNVPALTQNDVNAGKESVQSFVTITATIRLADGSKKPLFKSYQAALG